jgi:hypothetical protein
MKVVLEHHLAEFRRGCQPDPVLGPQPGAVQDAVQPQPATA